MQRFIGSISDSVPTALREVITVARASNGGPSTSLPILSAAAHPTDRPRQSTAASNASASKPSVWSVLTILDRTSRLRGSVYVSSTSQVQPAVQG